MNRFLLISMIVGLPLMANSQNHEKPYAGFQDRQITSLSAEDIADLGKGAGWGLALPAELNGFPGPRHILEHRDALELSSEQEFAIETMFAEMQAEAIIAGQNLIKAEQQLDDLFRAGSATSANLKEAIDNAAHARADLRFIHLSQHLKTIEILTPEQIETYNQLRGYGSDDPCLNVPEGHNEAMWRRHNGCDG